MKLNHSCLGCVGLGKVARRSHLPVPRIFMGLVYSPFTVDMEIPSV